MQHLNTEELARLVEETPTREERLHLELCGTCRAELDALREQTAALAELPALSPPERAWPLLQARLRHEGLVRRDGGAEHGVWRVLRAAAYVGIFVAGGATGLALSGGGASGDDAVAPARSGEEAALRLREAEAAYLAALSRYGQLTGQRDADPAARLAALEGIVLTTRAALDAAPADPVINGYYLTAVGQRDAVLRQIAQTSDDPWF